MHITSVFGSVFMAALLSTLVVACSGGGGPSEPAPALLPAAVAPSIAQQPASQSVVAGASATFAVTATGDAPLSYQWQRNGTDIAGAGSSTFTLGTALLPDQGFAFTAKVSNAAGTVISSTATLSVQPTGTLTLVAGAVPGATGAAAFADGPAASARFSDVTGLAVDSAGNVFVTDTYNQVVRKISTSGIVSTFAGTPGVKDVTGGPGFNLPAGLAIDSTGTLYLADGFPLVFGLNWLSVRAISPQGVVSTLIRNNVSPASLTVDTAGNAYIAGARISPTGQVSGIDISGAASSLLPGVFFGHAISADGTYYFASGNIIWTNPVGLGSKILAGAATPGNQDGPAEQARFDFAGTSIPTPQFQLPMVADSVGNLYLCDNNNLRRIGKDGFVTTLTGRPGTLAGVGVGGLEDQPFAFGLPNRYASCGALALRGDKTLYIGRGSAVLKMQLPF